MSLIDSLQFQQDCFIGHTVVMPKDMCQLYWEAIKGAMASLLDIGCIDDDQMLQLMVYKKHPDWHSIIVCDWFEDFLHCSHQVFTVIGDRKVVNSVCVEKTRHSGAVGRLVRKLAWCYRRVTNPDYPPRQVSDFVRRTKERQRKYY